MKETASGYDFSEEQAVIVRWLSRHAPVQSFESAGVSDLIKAESWFCTKMEQTRRGQTLSFEHHSGSSAELTRYTEDGVNGSPWDVTCKLNRRNLTIDVQTMDGNLYSFPQRTPSPEPAPPASASDPEWGTWA